MKSYLIPTLALGLLVSTVTAEDKANLTNTLQRTSYAIGMDIASTFKKQGMEVDAKALAAGLIDTLGGKPAFTEQEQGECLKALQGEMMAKQQARMAKQQEKMKKTVGETNLKAGEAFLATNAKKEGVKTTTSGLQYQVVKAGTGKSPKKTSEVKVHYHGTLIDGTVFDSSVDRGEPVTFPVDGVIPGWIEALQLMKVGDKWKLFIPAKLAYGERRAGEKIGPNSALIFDVELLSIEKE